MIDLRTMFGAKYQMNCKPPDDGPCEEILDPETEPLYYVIYGKHGEFHLWDEETMAATVYDDTGVVGKRLKDLDCSEVVEDRGNFVTIVFPTVCFADVAKVVEPELRCRPPAKTPLDATSAT